MKIQTKIGNLLHVKQGHIVHGCNAQGVMGSGVALGVKNTWPEVYADYRERWRKTTEEGADGIVGMEMGMAYPVTVVDNKLVVWNAITQNLYGVGIRQVSYDAIVSCFELINSRVREYKDYFPAEVHIPKIGAARGGGNWEIIREIIEQTVEFPVTLWLPDATVDTI